MNNYAYSKDIIISDKQAVTGLSVGDAKVLLGVHASDNQFDSLFAKYLESAINTVENYTECGLSNRKYEIPFYSWDGEMRLVGGGVIADLTVKDPNNADMIFTRVNSTKISIKSETSFTVKYSAGFTTVPQDIKDVVYNIIDIKFRVNELDEQKKKINKVLRSLNRYVRAERML
jgi:hypothetical protein